MEFKQHLLEPSRQQVRTRHKAPPHLRSFRVPALLGANTLKFRRMSLLASASSSRQGGRTDARGHIAMGAAAFGILRRLAVHGADVQGEAPPGGMSISRAVEPHR
ncbi:hypothetical protein BHK69_07775 [Bosea vaviloviae]|uniref:Uncharacterized protein n=1 Tax=Bosea vaviloviae TaxID=1526658 RepID=A0A1D7TZ29_9HYPH|nr:hypothetical protein BHK69_07775 [Bosea vaviloviae]